MIDLSKTSPEALQTWFNAHMPDENLIYKSGLARQVMFIRDCITGLLARSSAEYKQLPQVISTHTSKSVQLPVYYLDTAYAQFVLRYNFHDWKVSVASKVGPLHLDLESLCDVEEDIASCYCEGFQKEWVYSAFKRNKEQFTVELHIDERLYAFLFLLKREARRNGSFNSKAMEEKLFHMQDLLDKMDAFHVQNRAGKVDFEHRLEGYALADSFEAARDEAWRAPGVLGLPTLEAAFRALHEGSRFSLQESREPARALLYAVLRVIKEG